MAPTRLFIVLALALLAGCQTAPPTSQGQTQWYEHQAVSAHIVVHFGGNKRVDADFLFDPAVGKVRMTSADGKVTVFDGQMCWVSPGHDATPRDRFHVLTWPYFLAAPFKLNDPGSHLTDWTTADYNGKPHRFATLSFGDGVGDAPDDWYKLYIDDAGRLVAMAYIVTYGKDKDPANLEPHAITYHDFQDVGGVTLPMTWRFVDWSMEQGPHGDPRGHAAVTRVQFVTPPADAFTKPAGAAEVSLP